MMATATNPYGIGQHPGWRVTTLGELANHGTGFIQTGPFGSQLHARDYIDDGIPVVMPEQLGGNTISTDGIARVSETDRDRLSRHVMQVGDIVFSRRGDVTRRAYIGPQEAGWMCGTGCLLIRVRHDECDNRFLAYFFSLRQFKDYITQKAVGATMPNLNQGILSAIPLVLPPRPAQERIVGILSAYDGLLENNARRIKLLEDAARLLYEEWFVRLRFPGHEHTPIHNGLPEGWSKVPFEQALVLQRGFDLPVQDREEGTIPVYASTGITGFHSKAMVSGPGIVTGRSGTLGVVTFVPTDFWPLNTALWVREFRMVRPLFALFLLRNMKLEQYNGGVSVPTLDRKTVHRQQVVVPCEKMLRLFDEVAEAVFKQIQNLTQQNQKLHQARDMLLPRLMNGEIAV